MYSRNEYLQVLKQCYFKAESKKQKYQILNEYCRNTGQPENMSPRRYIKQILDLDRGKGRKGSRYMTAKLEVTYLRYGKSSTTPVGRASSHY